MKEKKISNKDHSFKRWFKLMWKNSYIFLFLVGFFGVITQLIMWDEMMDIVIENYSYSLEGAIMVTIGALIPMSIAIIVAYKGFWQFWNNIKNGNG